MNLLGRFLHKPRKQSQKEQHENAVRHALLNGASDAFLSGMAEIYTDVDLDKIKAEVDVNGKETRNR